MAGNPFADLLGVGYTAPNQIGGDITMPPSSPQAGQMGKGQLIAGILADALAGAMGRPGQFAQGLSQQKQQQDEEVQWQRRHQIEQADRPPYRWEANDGSLMEMGPDGTPRLVYKDPTPKANLDPDVFITLPNKQVYAGPRSGLAAAMGGSGVPAPMPVGKLTPIEGGPTPQASGGFRY
jgi:hypothetical protein